MKKITVKAYAKINICFDITGKDEENGMHFVDTVMQTIDLYDYITVTKRRDKICIVSSKLSILTGSIFESSKEYP